MRYRPFGQAGRPVSVIALTVDDRAGQRGANALAGLIFAAMEAGVNTFHIESCEPEVLATVGQALATVERQLLFVSVRLGPRSGRTGPARDFSPDALTGAIDQALAHTGLGSLDLVLLDEPGEDELPITALTALKHERTAGRVGLLGVAGAHDAMDAHLGARGAFDVLASPHHPLSVWNELNRLKKAAHMNMGVIAYDYFPELFRQASTTPGVPRKRRLLDAIAGVPEQHPLAGAGTYAFLHDTKHWTPEELCLACALMEPSVSTVLIRAHELERLEALAAVPDRDLPAGMAAKVEMARFNMQQAVSTSGDGGLIDAIKRILSHLGSFNAADAYATPASTLTGLSNGFADLEARGSKVRPENFLRYGRGDLAVERPRRTARALSAANWARLLPTPDPSLRAKAATPSDALSRAESGEASDLPLFDATPHQPPLAAQPSAALPRTAIWRSKDYDYPVQPTGESFSGPDGRTYLKVIFDGSPTFVPADEMIFPQEMSFPQETPPQPEPDDREALQALQARVAAITR